MSDLTPGAKARLAAVIAFVEAKPFHYLLAHADARLFSVADEWEKIAIRIAETGRSAMNISGHPESYAPFDAAESAYRKCATDFRKHLVRAKEIE